MLPLRSLLLLIQHVSVRVCICVSMLLFVYGLYQFQCVYMCVSAHNGTLQYIYMSPAGMKRNPENIMLSDLDCRNHKTLEKRHGSFAFFTLPKPTILNIRQSHSKGCLMLFNFHLSQTYFYFTQFQGKCIHWKQDKTL